MSDYRLSYVALSAALASFALAPQAHAQSTAVEGMVITASRAGPVAADRIGGSVTIIDAATLQDRQVRLVSDVLRDVPGVSVSRSGQVGGQTQVRLRGTEANQALVLIDGIEASDPAQGEFDFATLIADDVARVEVLRGQQSALYGSDAIGGVISYSTATGREAPGLRGSLETGSNNAGRASVRYGGVAGAFDYALSAAYQTTDGQPGVPNGRRDLGFESRAYAGKFTLDPGGGFRVKAALRYASTDADTNDFDYNFPPGPTYGLPVDGTNYYGSVTRLGLLRGEYDALDGAWIHALTAQINDTERRNFFAPGARSSATNALRNKYSYETTYRLTSGAVEHVFTGAVDSERETFQTLPEFAFTSANEKRHIDNTGIVAEYDGYVGSAAFGLAVRHDDNDLFKGATTFRMQGSYGFDSGLRLRAAAGSGIKNPTPIELFGYDPSSFIGNPDLKPERSLGWEVGAEQSFLDGGVKAGLALFDARLKDEIYTTFTPPTYVAGRSTKSTQRGVEATVAARLSPAWRLDAAYTYLDAKENSVREIRRPKSIASANLTWREPDGRFGATLTVRYNGEATDTYFGLATETKTLPAYTLVNLNADWSLGRGVSLYGRIENLADEAAVDVYGYASPGRTATIGLRAGF